MDAYSRRLFQWSDVSVSGVVLAGTDLSGASLRTLVTAKTGQTIYVQKIEIAVTTDNAATQIIQDTAGTPIKVAGTKASPGIGPITWDFGPDGFACTQDKGLSLTNSGAGLAYSYTVLAYQKQTANLVVA